MATVLAYTSPAIGHLYPMTPLLLELRRRGHDVHLRTIDSHIDRLLALGVKAEAIDPGIGALDANDWKATNPRDALVESVRTFSDRAVIDGPDLAQAIGETRPDALIVDINSWGARCAAEASGLPWVTFSPYTPPVRSAGVPPFGPGMKPMPGPLGKLRDGIARSLVLGAATRVMLPRMNAVRASHGLGAVGTVDEFFRTADLMVVTTSEPFEYPHPDWGDDILMIGACAWEPPADPPAWLDEIDRPLVLVTTSSEFQDDASLVRTAFAALADEPVTVVATMPAGVADGIERPANAVVEEYVPHGPVLDRAALAITHGGMGATQKALSRGVPVVVAPFGRDQLEVAARVEVSGAGTRVPRKRLTPETLRAAARTAMGLRDGARRVADGYATAGGAVAGADAIERRLLS